MRGAQAARLSLAVIAVLAFGCGGGSSSPTEPAQRRDTLVLLSAEPAEGSRLQLGGRAQISARFRYTLAQAGGGKISVLVHPLPFGVPILTDPLLAEVDVNGQEGEATLSFEILLDDSFEPLQPGPIAANFALFPEGQTRSETIVLIRYEVVR